MQLIVLLFVYAISWCAGVRLSPLENNDKLQDISNQYVAEWQWESWPIKEEPLGQNVKSPGPRLNVALWKDNFGPNWYLFGGQPVDSESKKIYSDVWKYSVVARVWERFFPAQSEMKETKMSKIGGMITLRANLFEEGHSLSFKRRNYNVVLCGGTTKLNSTKTKKLSLWNNFTRRKKKEEQKDEELKSLAIYSPQTSKANTVWQIDLKNKMWTAYVCCCDTTKTIKENSTSKISKSAWNLYKRKNETKFKIEKNISAENNESLIFDFNINNSEDEIDNKQQHLRINNLKKKINQSKNNNEYLTKKIKIEKRDGNTNKTKITPFEKDPKKSVGNRGIESTNYKSNTQVDINTEKEKHNFKMKNMSNIIKTENVELLKNINATKKLGKMEKAKLESKYCPEFSEGGKPVTWCDSNNKVLITTDINSPLIVLWIFNLKTSHWSQQEVKISNDIEWPCCSNTNPVRYAGIDEEVYIICSPPETHSNTSSEFVINSTNPSKNPSENNFSIKVVYRINYKHQILESLGELQLNSYFTSLEGQKIWQNDSKSILQVIRTPENQTILLLAYSDNVDLWILSKSPQDRHYFDLIEKLWRGSALKWLKNYSVALYNLQFVSETGNSETILIPNPRNIAPNDYWPRERGRFIIRIFKNENLKNQSFENRTREQNLTYELLQSDLKSPSTENQFNYTYSLKIFLFFGISLSIFIIIGFVIFLKRCVNCPPRISVRNECHKSPLVIRYSVIPDDMLYPLA